MIVECLSRNPNWCLFRKMVFIIYEVCGTSNAPKFWQTQVSMQLLKSWVRCQQNDSHFRVQLCPNSSCFYSYQLHFSDCPHFPKSILIIDNRVLVFFFFLFKRRRKYIPIILVYCYVILYGTFNEIWYSIFLCLIDSFSPQQNRKC